MAYWHRVCWGCFWRYCWNIEIHVYKQNEIKIVVQELTSRFKTIDRNNVYLQIFNWFLSSTKHNPWFKINLLLIFYWLMINFALDSPSIWRPIISQILKMLTSSLRISLSFSSSHPLHTAVWRTATHLLHFCLSWGSQVNNPQEWCLLNFNCSSSWYFWRPPLSLKLALWGPQQCVLFVRHGLFISIGVCTDD